METVPSPTVARSIKSGPLWPNTYLFLHVFICQAPALVIIQGKGERKGEGERKEKEREPDRGGRNTGREEEGRKAEARGLERKKKRE